MPDRTRHNAADEAFRKELLSVLPHLRAFARGLCGRPDFADDLVQEAAIKAWTARERYTPGTNMRAWTFAILRNHYLSELRRSKRSTELDEGAAERMLVMEADQEGPLHLSDMEDALQKLAPERREAVLLIGASGFSYEEAAEIAGCPIGTMKSRVARARTDLARMLDGEPEIVAEDRARRSG
ncbi:sigma-70 family RNA polymerase sigma factor [Novosphingobium pentaromativorans]|uniref:RNA polymerase sigma-70 factor, ECF subfamily n=1 Tax=Novosphingobium pentaromativorans US6-1 TaxID=1088721 RepID=G6EE21_9SPHN|nr:sigma-70 family RNA polymerase sigma factor [Novosphingobium pentaromativorans]AIT79569.1 RNA polymerase sigma70 [Novosphingobium pentaromativorans US6-1]EHJ60462.1 RNA polymerase sigma-70 factor, ECF subfamily [Novosphingobium pentaromativorans US6-1]